MSVPAPDRDARILSRLRAWWADNAAHVTAIPGYRVPVEVDEFEVLMRQADENSTLQRARRADGGGRVRLAWTMDVDTAIALYELVGSPTPVDGDRRPTDHLNGHQNA